MADAPQDKTNTNTKKPDDVVHIRTFARDVAAVTGKPLPDTVVNAPAPAPKRVAPPPPEAKIIPKAPSTNESREAVLARLRATAGIIVEQKRAPDEEVAPKTREELLARLRSKVPPTPYKGEAMEKRVAPPPPPPPPPPGIPPVAKQGLAPIHTYKSDFAELAGKKGATPLTILSAQQDAPAAPKVITTKKRLPVSVIAGIALMLVGVLGVTFAYIGTRERPAVEGTYVPSLIFADDYARIEGSGTSLQEAVTALALRELQEGGVIIAYVTHATTSEAGQVVERPATGGALIAALGLPAPELLLRNTEAASTVGVVRAGGETRAFFLLRVSSYERTFAGLLAWEKTMADDLTLFYPLHSETTTATSTAPAFSQPTTFEDVIIANHDARVLRDTQGRTILLYGYKDKETLIIARNEAAFTELLERLSATRAQ